MNCKHVQELLPLHVGGDLEAKRAQLVNAHTQTCAECNAAAEAYRSSRRLMQQFAPPQFSESVYAELRQNVLREISHQPNRVSLSELIAGLFQPRWTWVAATAVLILVLGLAILVGPRKSVESNLETKVEDPSVAPTPVSPLKDRVKLALNARVSSPTVRWNSTASRAQRVVHSTRVMKTGVSVETARHRLMPKSPNNSEPTLEKTVRLEMQTKDPNIRIIWFTHQRPEENLPGESSKGF